MAKKCVFALFSALAILLASCGGSSTKTISGVFTDSPVAGLTYTCGTTKGTTASGGAFTCPAASSVEFNVGGVVICQAPAQSYMTPISCAQANGSASANASTPEVVAVAQFLISIGTPTGTTPGTLSSLTITSAELTAAATLNLDFATATQAQLLAAVTTVNPGQTLASAATAENELAGTVTTIAAGTYSGSYSGDDTGTWSLTISSSGSVTGTYTSTVSGNGSGTLAGSLVNGTTYSGTYSGGGGGTWTGTVNTAQPPTTGKGPYLLSGTWANGAMTVTGSFTN